MAERIYVGGTFDLFHSGHVNLLKACSLYGNVVVALNKDDFVERYKGRRPAMTLEERLDVVSACRYVWQTAINVDDEDSRSTIIRYGATFIAHGDDWKGDALMKQMGFNQKWLDERDIKMLYVPYTESVSSTEIRRRIIDQAFKDLKDISDGK